MGANLASVQHLKQFFKYIQWHFQQLTSGKAAQQLPAISRCNFKSFLKINLKKKLPPKIQYSYIQKINMNTGKTDV